MRTKIIKGLIFIALLLLVGCVTQPQRLTQTASGRPEIVVSTDDLDRVKSEIINEMQVFDYLLEDDSKYRLCFTKELKIDAGTAFLGQVMLGYSQGKKPKEESVYNLSQTNNGIKIIEFSSVIWFRDSYGTIPERMDMKANNAWFNAFYNILQKIKTNIESSPNSGAFKEGKIDIETKKEDEKKESIPEGLLPKSLYGL